MSDEKLVALLDWETCRGADSAGYGWCVVHESRFRLNVCDEMIDRLDCVEQGMELVTPILTDLIAELRSQAGIWREPEGDPDEGIVFALCAGYVEAFADRAEARLREVTGDE